jgi:eukaryotic-like serine/threonine-protein kinase
MTEVMSTAGIRVLAGRYALGEVLGAGGMATVYRARDEVLGREVAVKVLSPQYATDPGFLARFEREARHVAALTHPRIVTVFDCGVDGTTPFMVMELVAGRTLRQVLDEAGPLPPGEAVGIAAAVCEALAAAHAAGLVHRDIKPANIVLSGGQVKVLDFGIARAADPAAATRTQTVLGTAAYLSPEQASGGRAGPASDLYSLGCVLFEMLTGAPPFTGDSAVGIAYRHVHADPGPPSARRPGLPARLDQITARLLAKDPAARPPGAAVARAELLAAQAPDRTEVLTGPPDAIPGPPPRRPRTIEAILAIALAFALTALAAVLLTGAARPAGAPATSSSAPATAAASHQPVQPSAGSHPAVQGPAASHPAAQPSAASLATPGTSATGHASTLPATAAAAATFVGDLDAAVANGQVTQQAGQQLFNQLSQLLFQAPGQGPQQVDQQYAQLVQVYDQEQAQGQITGPAAATLRHALEALGATIGAL